MQGPFPIYSVAKAVAGTVIIAVLMVLLLPAAPVLMLFLPLPGAYLTARFGWMYGLSVAVVAAALVYLGAGVSVALLTFLVCVSVGMTLGWALRQGWRFPRSLVVMSGALLVAFIVYGLVLWLGLGVTYTLFKGEWHRFADDITTAYTQAGISAATASSIADYVRQMADVLPYIAPGLVVMMAVLVPAATAGLGYLIFPRLRRPQMVGMTLSGFRMHWGVAYVSIVGLALLLFARSGEGWRAYMFYAGVDLLMVSQTLFFLQALAVLRWFGNSRRWKTGSRAGLMIFAIIAQLFQVTGLIGLSDTWIDYRKRFALRDSGPGRLR